jgi:hypothetical protein
MQETFRTLVRDRRIPRVAVGASTHEASLNKAISVWLYTVIK